MNWFLTINNPDSNELPQHPSEKYAIWQLEKGESGTLHLQCTLVMKNQVHFGAIKKLYPRANNSKVRKLPNAIQYCQKEGTRVEGPWTRGEPPKGQGKRTDLQAALDIIISNLGSRRQAGKFKQACVDHRETMARYQEPQGHNVCCQPDGTGQGPICPTGGHRGTRTVGSG